MPFSRGGGSSFGSTGWVVLDLSFASSICVGCAIEAGGKKRERLLKTGTKCKRVSTWSDLFLFHQENPQDHQHHVVLTMTFRSGLSQPL